MTTACFADCRPDWRRQRPRPTAVVPVSRHRRKRWMGADAEAVDRVSDTGRKCIRPWRKISPLARCG
jgi:hypothetical protein